MFVANTLDLIRSNVAAIGPGRFREGLPEALDDSEAMRRGFQSAAPFRVRCTAMERHPATPPINSSILLYDVTFTVTVTRTITVKDQVSPSEFADLEAQGWDDTILIRQRLCTPPNLASSDLAGGILRWTGSTGQITPIRAGAQRYDTIHTFRGVLKVNP